jgi:hypothetical protein
LIEEGALFDFLQCFTDEKTSGEMENKIETEINPQVKDYYVFCLISISQKSEFLRGPQPAKLAQHRSINTKVAISWSSFQWE